MLLFILLFSFFTNSNASCITKIKFNGMIGQHTVIYLEDGINHAKANNCSSILIIIDTPGGLLTSTRLIVQKIMNSYIPIMCLVAPKGAHAGSAGAIILQACHINGALTATNIGAATPVNAHGKLSEDMRKKMINDTSSWIESLARERKRSIKFARDIVRKAKAVDAKLAKDMNAIDIYAKNEQDFLAQAFNKKIKISDTMVKVKKEKIIHFDLSLKISILKFFSDPQIAYLMFSGGAALLFFELTHPGMIVPGVIGSLAIIISLISFNSLEVFWGGLGLLVLGMIFMVSELFVPSFGILGIGGTISFALGSLLLFDVNLPIPLILVVTGILGVLVALLIWLVTTTRKKIRGSSLDEMCGDIGKVIISNGKKGVVLVDSEKWKFISEDEVKSGDQVEIIFYQGLTLQVKKYLLDSR